MALDLDGSTRGFFLATETAVYGVSPARKATLLAGSAKHRGDLEAVGEAARFGSIACIRVSKDGTVLYVADSWYHKIKMIALATRAVVTIAGSGAAGDQDGIGEAGDQDGVGAAAQFTHPSA